MGERQYLVHLHIHRLSEDFWILLAYMGSNAHEFLKAWEDERAYIWCRTSCQTDVS